MAAAQSDFEPRGDRPSASNEREGVTTNRTQAVYLPTPNAENAFQFVVFGDRTGGVAAGLEVLRQAVKDTNLLAPDMVMTVGDLIQGYNDTPDWLDQMREYKTIMGDLSMPWFPVAGNHDIYWRGRGKAPQGHHESNYEKHFGPLWYSFAHKDCGFLVLYSDEGNSQNNRKGFHAANLQQISERQLAFIDQELDRFKQKSRVFVFLHHPRWIGGSYTGSNWNVVHQRFVKAGNVAAVFAGHIHHQRYDKTDGIEYHTLATTGGVLNGDFPDAGYLHHFNVVTVRQNKVAVTTVPVGAVMNPKRFTGEFLADFERARSIQVEAKSSPLRLNSKGETSGVAEFHVSNPCHRSVEFTVVFDAGVDRRNWQAPLSHQHFVLTAGERKVIRLPLQRSVGDLDYLVVPELNVRMEYLASAVRVRLEDQRVLVPIILDLKDQDMAGSSSAEKCLQVIQPQNAIRIDNDLIPLDSQSAITLEAYVRPLELAGHNAIVAKTQSSEYALFARDGVPEFSIHLGGRYVNAQANEPLVVDRWTHLAGVYDGTQVRLFVDGQLVDQKPGRGKRRLNRLPLYIGADPDANGRPTRPLKMMIDDVCLTPSAVYQTPFKLNQRPVANDGALLWLDFNQRVGQYAIDRSTTPLRGVLMPREASVVVRP